MVITYHIIPLWSMGAKRVVPTCQLSGGVMASEPGKPGRDGLNNQPAQMPDHDPAYVTTVGSSWNLVGD